MRYTKETLVQQTTAEHLEKELGWLALLKRHLKAGHHGQKENETCERRGDVR